jgi:transcriptional regulator with XRE-family HTH domain
VDVNIKELKKLAKSKCWSLPKMAEIMGLDYSFLYRVIQGERKPGGKFFSGLMLLCMKEGLDFEQFVCFEEETGTK